METRCSKPTPVLNSIFHRRSTRRRRKIFSSARLALALCNSIIYSYSFPPPSTVKIHRSNPGKINESSTRRGDRDVCETAGALNSRSKLGATIFVLPAAVLILPEILNGTRVPVARMWVMQLCCASMKLCSRI